jgi:hypothetical protein
VHQIVTTVGTIFVEVELLPRFLLRALGLEIDKLINSVTSSLVLPYRYLERLPISARLLMPGLIPLKQRGAPATPESLIWDPIQSIVISQKHGPKIAYCIVPDSARTKWLSIVAELYIPHRFCCRIAYTPPFLLPDCIYPTVFV